jgi:hydroxymethylglutaryl-CoA lyase
MEHAHRPLSVRVVEVGPRDGLQNEAAPVATAVKAELVRRLLAAGVTEIELTSFVRPDRIPQLADAEALLAEILPLPEVRAIALAPNLRALERARAAGIMEVAVFGAASEAFSQSNLGCSIDESLAMFSSVAREAVTLGMSVRGYVSTILGCPFQGPVPADDVARVTGGLFDLGCHEVSLGDTIGVAGFWEVHALLAYLGARFGVDRFSAHMHDSYGQGLANSLAALEAGVPSVDASVGGLGGCPFAGGGARGNLATEDLVYALDRSGVATGIDLGLLVDTAVWISNVLGRPPASRVASRLGRPQ